MIASTKAILKQAYSFYQKKRFHSMHRKQAFEALGGVEKDRGKTDPSLLKLSDEYAADVFGSPIYAPWLYVYSAVQGTFREGWMPDNYFGSVVQDRTKGNYAYVSALRAMQSYIFQDPAFPDIGFMANGRFLDEERRLRSFAEMQEHLFQRHTRVVFKVDGSVRGEGVRFLERDKISAKSLSGLPDGVFQSFIKQHPFFDRFTDASVATLRMTTAQNPSGEVSVRAAYVRMGQGRDTHVQSESHIRVSVDLKTGELSPKGYRPDWTMLDAHPDRQEPFAGKHVPNFDGCVRTVCSLHEKFPFIHSIGWDVVVDHNDNVQVMEWNGGHNDIKFSEATQGPCFQGFGWEPLWKTSEQ
jgi:hypothetical protein